MHPLEAIRWRKVYSNKESEKKIHTCHYAEMLYSKLQIDKVYLISNFFKTWKRTFSKVEK